MTRRKFIGLLFLLAGIALIAWPFVSDYQREQEAEHLKKQWTNSLKIVDAKETKQPLAKSGVGLLSIPSIDFEQVILEGSTTAVLDRSIGHIPKTGSPGKGNYALAGHRSFTEGLHFNRLPDDENTSVYVPDHVKSSRHTDDVVRPRSIRRLPDDYVDYLRSTGNGNESSHQTRYLNSKRDDCFVTIGSIRIK